MKSKIAQKLILYTILFSSVITLIITALQLYTEFKYDVKEINQKLEQIKTSYKESITQSLWISDNNQLQTIVNGITELPDIIYSRVHDDINTDISSGDLSIGDIIEYKMDLNYFYNNKNINIGEFTVTASLADVYNRLLNRLWIILLSNALKTSLVAIFIYFLFSRLVTRHLSKISKFSEEHDSLSSTPPLSLDRTNNQHDEFDSVVESINSMHARLHEQITEINQKKLYLSQTLNSIGNAVITTNNDGLITQLNPVAEQLTGWKNHAALNQPLNSILSLIDTTSQSSVEIPIDAVLKSGKTFHLNERTTLISKDGSEYQISNSASPIRYHHETLGMVLVFNDVTEQIKMRDALRDSEKKLQLIYSQVPGIVYQFKVDIDGTKSLPYVSPSVESHIGLSAQAVMENADNWFDLTHPDDLPKLEQSITDSLINLSLWEWEGRFILKNKKTVWLHGSSTPERMANGSTVWNGIFIDITERVLAEDVMLRSQKMDALGKLTGGIAHDYNNMLGVILGYSELLIDTLEDSPKLQGFVEKINHSALRGAKLTKKLLAFSTNKSSDAEKTNINRLLNDTHNILEKTLTARIALTLKLEENVWPVFLDAGDLEDAILNMSINAMHAIERNGEFIIETKNINLDTTQSKSLELDSGEYIKLSFIDTGCGMDKATKEKIFDPFYSSKGDKGTGLGLSQVYGFITRCGGAIRVESTPEIGSDFSLFFPRYFGESMIETQIEAKDYHHLNGDESILVVDDEVDLLSLACEILRQHGYHIYSAESANDALEIIKANHIDLLISDIIMPDIDGYELASRVQKSHPNIKIQLASGYSQNSQIEEINKSLSQNILPKPYSSHTLLQKTRELLDS